DKYLLSKSSSLVLSRKFSTGSVPLWFLRRYVLPKLWSESLDRWGCRNWPNLFGGQVLIEAIKK
ncbi:MAG: hypothetical protein ACRERX_05525, partial [Pseudomonas sp.]